LLAVLLHRAQCHNAPEFCRRTDRACLQQPSSRPRLIFPIFPWPCRRTVSSFLSSCRYSFVTSVTAVDSTLENSANSLWVPLTLESRAINVIIVMRKLPYSYGRSWPIAG